MPASKPPVDGDVPADDLARIIAACDRLEADWNAGLAPRIEDDLVGGDEPVVSRLFGELLALELELLRRDGGSPELGAYIARFPERAGTVWDVFAGQIVTASSREPTDSVTKEDLSNTAMGYDLIRKLSQGGQARTYLVRDRALERLVVLKRYHGITSAARRQVVLNEGRALARIRSPFVAKCYGVETRGNEIDLIVEYVPGRPIAELTADERADLRRCVRLVVQVAGGLAEVHVSGVLHRDVKPENIILGDDGMPRLVDFGLAVPVAHGARNEISGSPRYMAPEQARGQGERVDARTDVYGLGAVLYYLLTGQPPHDGNTVDETLERAREALIVPPRRRNPRIPRTLEWICLKAMAVDPQARFQSAVALRSALRAYVLTQQVAPIVVGIAVLFAMLVPFRVFWPAPARSAANGMHDETAGRATTEPPPKSTQSPQAGLRVTRFEIPHFPKLDEKTYDHKAAGLLGRKSFRARVDDDVTVQAELSEPAFSYLIAFRPDGTNELCDPEDESAQPPRKQRPMYPPPGKSNERYRLSEGTGLYAFALVVSRQPLPSYCEWKKRIGRLAWTARAHWEPGVIWRDDGEGLQAILANDPARVRGKGAEARGSGEPAAKLASWLRGLPGVDAVIVEAFSVEPIAAP
jgi:serine/threonine protein kinase